MIFENNFENLDENLREGFLYIFDLIDDSFFLVYEDEFLNEDNVFLE